MCRTKSANHSRVHTLQLASLREAKGGGRGPVVPRGRRMGSRAGWEKEEGEGRAAGAGNRRSVRVLCAARGLARGVVALGARSQLGKVVPAAHEDQFDQHPVDKVVDLEVGVGIEGCVEHVLAFLDVLQHGLEVVPRQTVEVLVPRACVSQVLCKPRPALGGARAARVAQRRGDQPRHAASRDAVACVAARLVIAARLHCRLHLCLCAVVIVSHIVSHMAQPGCLPEIRHLVSREGDE